MLFSTCTLSILFFCIVPCFAPNPTVTIENGITEQDVKDANYAMGIDDDARNQTKFWELLFADEASRMLPYALSLLALERRVGNGLKKNQLNIGAIVSISGNGGGFMQLMGHLKARGYKQLTIIVIVNPKENSNQDQRYDYIAFTQIVSDAGFTNDQLFWLEQKEVNKYDIVIPANPEVQGDAPKNVFYSKVTVAEATEKLSGTRILFDGICGGGFHATTLDKDFEPKDLLTKALEILPGVCPPNKVCITKIVSHSTPSGRTEKGEWASGEFACYSIISTTFPLEALKKDKKKDIPDPGFSTVATTGSVLGAIAMFEAKKGASPVKPNTITAPTVPKNIWLLESPPTTNPVTKKSNSFLEALKTEVPTMIDDVEAVLASVRPTTRWVDVVAK